jgi:DNA anti-recombination protein RmuC
MNVDGKISIDKLMELKSEELKKEADKIQLDITNEEEMDLIKRIEEQEELINGLATQIKQLLDNEKIKADEILARQEEERKQLEEKERIKQKEKDLKLKNKNEENEITIDEFKVIIQTDTQKIVDKAFEDLNAKFQKLQDDIVRLTGSI